MRGFAAMNKLKKEALKVIAAGMSQEEIAGLRTMFQVRLCRIQLCVTCSCNSEGTSKACTHGIPGGDRGTYYPYNTETIQVIAASMCQN